MSIGPSRQELNFDDPQRRVESVFLKEVIPSVVDLAMDTVTKGIYSCFSRANRNDMVANPNCALREDNVDYDALYADCLV